MAFTKFGIIDSNAISTPPINPKGGCYWVRTTIDQRAMSLRSAGPEMFEAFDKTSRNVTYSAISASVPSPINSAKCCSMRLGSSPPWMSTPISMLMFMA